MDTEISINFPHIVWTVYVPLTCFRQFKHNLWALDTEVTFVVFNVTLSFTLIGL